MWTALTTYATGGNLEKDMMPVRTVTRLTGQELAALRRAAGMTQTQLAKTAGIGCHALQEAVTDLRKRLDRAEERILALAAPPASERPQKRPDVAPARGGVEPPRPSRSFLGRLLGR